MLRVLSVVAYLAVFPVFVSCGGSSRPAETQAEILRDEYGVPHIFAGDLSSAAFAWGYVNAEDLREQILMNLYAGEGRAAEVFGRDCGEQGDCTGYDFKALTYDLTDIIEREYGKLKKDTRTVLEAYAAGVNHFFENLDPPSENFVRPVTAQGVIGTMMGLRMRHGTTRSLVWDALEAGASNQYAATGARTAVSTTVVSVDPHTPWDLTQPAIHVHFGDYDIVGSSVSFPAIHCGGNNFVHWGCTTLRSATTVVVQAEISVDGQKYFDHQAGDFVDFETRNFHIEVAGEPDGADREVQYTRWGPVLGVREGYAYVAHLFCADDITVADFFIGSWLSKSFDDFKALWDQVTPADTSTNRIFGSADHRVGYVYGAYLPELDQGLDWTLPVSSADPRIEWEPERWYNLDGTDPELPHVFEPDGDFVQNCNGHPAWSTDPSGQIPKDIPKTLNQGGGPSPRGRRLLELLSGAQAIDAEKAMEIAVDLKVPHGENGIEALRRGLDAAGITDPVAEFGADVGELMNIALGWRDESGYQATADSEPMTILYHLDRIGSPDYPAPGYTMTRADVDALAAGLGQVATYMRNTYAGTFADPLHVPWGYINTATVGGEEIQMPGGNQSVPSLFMAWGELQPDGRMQTETGSHYMQVAAYTANGFEVYLTVPNGQTNERLFPESPHVGQTIEDFQARRYRKIWLERSEIESHLCPHVDALGHEHRARTELIYLP